MDFTFSAELESLRRTVRRFTEDEVKPLAEQIDRQAEVPRRLIDRLVELGIFGIPFPKEYGGAGLGELGYCVMMEELGHGCASVSATIAAHVSIGVTAIALDGGEALKRAYLPALCSGEKLAAYALTEAGAGSDAGAMRTAARDAGEAFILNGEKMFITNGGFADIITTFAVTDAAKRSRGGITCFVVEAGWPGVSTASVGDKMGLRGSSTTFVRYADVRVPKENVVGRVGEGFRTAMRTQDIGRLSIAATALGATKEVLALCRAHAAQQPYRGKPLAEQQVIQFMLADIAAHVYAIESMLYRCAWMADQGMPFTREASITKMLASDMQDRVIDLGLQIQGAAGVLVGSTLERFYRDARISRIFEGTNEIQRLVIARDVLQRGAA